MKVYTRFAIVVLGVATLFPPLSVNAASALSPSTIIAVTNQSRKANNAGKLLEDAALDRAAQNKADDMATVGYFSHVAPSGKNSWDWFRSIGYYYLNAGENLAMNFTSNATLESAWMNSPTHRANIIKPVYTRTGVGIARGLYMGKPTTFVVQFFATPA